MPVLEQAILHGVKTETRRPITAKNSTMTRGEWDDVDWTSGRPDQLYPTSSLKVRFQTGDVRRSSCISPRIRPGHVLWPRRGQSGEGAKRENARVKMRVVQVQAVRLCDLSEVEAHAEGIRYLSPRYWEMRSYGYEPGSEIEAAVFPMLAREAYEALLDRLGKINANRWRRGPVHLDIGGRTPTARDAFALLWDTINGLGSWSGNPWVWRYVFQPITPHLAIDINEGPTAEQSAQLAGWLNQ